MEAVFIGPTIWTGNKGNEIIEDGALVVTGNKISGIGKANEIEVPRGYDRIVLSSKHVIMPGLINAHAHQAMTLLRGYADDMELSKWLNEAIFPFENELKYEDVYIGALLASIESIRTGVTTVNSMYHFPAAEIQAVEESGLRGMIAEPIFDMNFEKSMQRWKNLEKKYRTNPKIRTAMSPHSAYTCNPENWHKVVATASETNKKRKNKQNSDPVVIHTHIAETEDETSKTHKLLDECGFKKEFTQFDPKSNGLVEYLDQIGVLGFGCPITAAHGVHLTEKDLQIAKRNQISIIHNPVSNLKLASGIANVPKMISKGITVTLGTDGAASNNSLNMFETIKLASILHKGIRKREPTTIPANKALHMATSEAAKALFWSKLGIIQEEYLADFCILDFNKTHLTPLYDIESHLVYAVNGFDVISTVIDGRFVMEDREILTLDEMEVIKAVEESKDAILNRLKNK